MKTLKLKLAGLYCTQCAEQVESFLKPAFKITHFKFDTPNQFLTLNYQSKIDKTKLIKTITSKGYGPVLNIT